MANNYKYKKVVRSWTKRDGTKVTKTYYYGPGGRVVDEKISAQSTGKYKPGVARQKQKEATEAKRKAAKIKKRVARKQAKASGSKRIQNNRRYITDKTGKVIEKVYDELIDKIKRNRTIGVAEKESYIDWLDSNRKTRIEGHKNLSISSAMGILRGSKIAIMLENTGFGIGAMVGEMKRQGDKGQTIDELLDESNWTGESIYTSPRGFSWRFKFKYNKFPFMLISSPKQFAF